ncbi:hypothetical protein Dip510_001865 [Elusimicrobium posterum]|uniref:hypothetical protein n=1 Tax=Elusimicrobium posterum TaxID=3116653 RepID=UPI003C70EAF1
MIITDLSQNPAVNNSINLKDIGNNASGKVDCLQVLATGTLDSGEVKLTCSQDNENYYPLNDEDGVQIVLTPGVPVYLKFANIYIKCDILNLISSDLKVWVQ